MHRIALMSVVLISACGQVTGSIMDPADGSDVTSAVSPAVYVAYPKASATIGGTKVALSAGVANVGATKRVDFLLDGVFPIGPAAPGRYGYLVTFDSTKLSDGAHTATAIATANDGSKATSAILTFNVNNNSSRKVWIASPTPLATLNGVKAGFSAGVSGIASPRVTYLLDGTTTLGPAVASEQFGYLVSFDSTKLSTGLHVTVAQATDSSGRTTTSTPLYFLIANPTVKVAQPTAGMKVAGNIVLDAVVDTLSDFKPTSITFQVDGRTVGTAAAGPVGYGYTWSSATVANGSHTVTVRATNGQLTVTSAAIAFTTNNSSTASLNGPDHFGVNIGNLTWGYTADQMAPAMNDAKAMGAHSIRQGFLWSDIQYNGPNSWDWASYDRIMQATNKAGLKVLAVLTYSPKWAIGSQFQGLTSKGDWERHEPTDPNAFAKYAGAVAARYASQGLHDYEIWNEANCYYWTPNSTSGTMQQQIALREQHYAALLKAAYVAIKAADPQAVVVSSGLAPYGQYGQANNNGTAFYMTDGKAMSATGAATCVNPLNFLEGLYAQGVKGFFDGLGWHPYNGQAPSDTTPWNGFYEMYGTTPSVLSIEAKNGDSKQIWMTEFGYPVGNDAEASNFVTHGGQTNLQAQFLAWEYDMISKSSWAGPGFWYDYQDGLFQNDQSYGLNASSGSDTKPGPHRPAWYAFQAAANAAAGK